MLNALHFNPLFSCNKVFANSCLHCCS